MQDEFLVHTREGEPCPSCGGPIVADRRRRPLDLLLPELPGARCAANRAQASAGRPVNRQRSVAGKTVKTEAVVLRSIRYGEADRILHLYSTARGRVGAIAKGVRKPSSRFGGRLEPFFRLDLILHEGRGELLTVTNVSTVDGYPRLRSSAAALNAGARACDAVLRLLDSAEPNPPAYNLLCRYLALLDDPGRSARAALEAALSFRLKLALAAGFAPELASCARCGEAEHLAGFSGAAGGVVCAGCEAGSFPLSEEAHRFMVEAIAKPLAEAPRGRGARPAPGRARGRRDARAPRARPAARRRLRKLRGRCIEAPDGHSRPSMIVPVPATVNLEDRVRAWEAEFLSERRRAPTRPSGASRRPTARCARRSSATATGSSTRRPSAASSTRPRSSSPPRATTTGPA